MQSWKSRDSSGPRWEAARSSWYPPTCRAFRGTLPAAPGLSGSGTRCWPPSSGISPGHSFLHDGSQGERFLRLNFATQPPEVIEKGIRRLARALREYGRKR